ncbi:TolC family protein [Stakelama marina]|uniref:TolC family protein n=1 Tax=Stakelama marina TaxID=2826939 RepID=A0A8T4I8G6_9SPHN|nr:TolC family protein [Stakelama marina]MBR0551278.1 TolC family protein [Stakelama marina]
MRKSVFFAASALALVAASPVSAQDLDTTIGLAFENSHTLAAARAREEAAKAGVDAARAERAPSARVEGQIGVGRIDPQGFFGLTADDVTPRSAKATVELPLFTGGRVSAGIAQAQAGAESAALQTQMTALQLRVDVVRAYTDALAAKALADQYGALTDALDEAVRHAKLRFKAGEGTSTEVAQAQARRAEAEAGLAAAQGRIASARTRLEALAGQPVTVESGLPDLPPIPSSTDEAMAGARSNNPRLAQSERAIDAARAGLKAAHAERLPTVGAYAEAASVRDQFFPGYKADSGSVGLRARWDIFTGGRTAAKEKRADAELRAAQADAVAARLAVDQQAVEAFEAVRTAKVVRSAADDRVRAADAALRGTKLEVKAGAKPQLALLDAEREAIEAHASRIKAEGDLLVAAYRLRAVTGMD